MMPSESLFIPLYFDEAESDLWSALQKIEPEKRSSFIKNTLRQALLNEVQVAEVILQDNRQPRHEEVEIDSFEDEREETESFSLEDLFTAVQGLDSEPVEQSLAGPKEINSSPQRGPWDFLLNSVIGVEEDEEVIAALQHSVHPKVQEEKRDNLFGERNQSEQRIDEPEEVEDEVQEQTFDIESLQVDTPVPSSGFEYMMKQIIGTEEDEVVLRALRRAGNESSN